MWFNWFAEKIWPMNSWQISNTSQLKSAEVSICMFDMFDMHIKESQKVPAAMLGGGAGGGGGLGWLHTLHWKSLRWIKNTKDCSKASCARRRPPRGFRPTWTTSPTTSTCSNQLARRASNSEPGNRIRIFKGRWEKFQSHISIARHRKLLRRFWKPKSGLRDTVDKCSKELACDTMLHIWTKWIALHGHEIISWCLCRLWGICKWPVHAKQKETWSEFWTGAVRHSPACPDPNRIYPCRESLPILPSNAI